MGDSPLRPESSASSDDEVLAADAAGGNDDEALATDAVAASADAHAVFPPNRHVVYTNYGRAAFEAILHHRGLRGATVVLPAFLCKETFVPIFDDYDLNPAFVDVDPQTYRLDFERASREARDADALLLVHTFGAPANAERWRRLANERDVVLIEDCARALGASLGGRPIGGVGDYAIYSLPKVSPVARGGVLAAPPGEGPFDLESPTYDLKHAHPLLPDALEGVARVGYRQFRRVRGDFESTDDQKTGESDDRERGEIDDRERNETNHRDDSDATWAYDSEWEGLKESPTPRKLDLVNRFVFERHLRREFDAGLRWNGAAARRVRRTAANLDIGVQRVEGTSPYHVVGMTVPRRDELASQLRDADVPVETCWNSPLVTAFDDGDLSSYPNTKILAEQAFQLPLFRMDDDEVTKALGVLAERMASEPEVGVERN